MKRTAPIVLGVVGSPRHGGNTELLVEEVLRGARDAGAQTDKVILPERRPDVQLLFPDASYRARHSGNLTCKEGVIAPCDVQHV